MQNARNIPVKLPLQLNLTPLVTITYLDLANMNSGHWTCLPQVAHTILNPSIEMNVEMLSTLHLQNTWNQDTNSMTESI